MSLDPMSTLSMSTKRGLAIDTKSLDQLNSNAMHRALEWLDEHAPDLEEILDDDAFNQVDEWGAALEQELGVA